MEIVDTANQLNGLYGTYAVLLKENPLLATAVSLWGMAVITFILWRLPRTVMRTVKRQLTTSLELTSDSHPSATIHAAFMSHHSKNKLYKFSRMLALKSAHWGGFKVKTGPGRGRHWLKHNGKLFWFTIADLDSSGSERQKQRLILHTLGRTQKPLLDLVEDFRPKQPAPVAGSSKLYIPHEEDWMELSTIPKRELDTVITRGDLKDRIIEAIERWRGSEDWYARAGINYKLSMMLYGQPGTGKSSLIRALAGYMGLDLCMLDISTVSYQQLLGLLSNMPDGSALLLEDIDGANVTHDRTAEGEKERTPLNMAQLLNVLDGALPLNDVVIFMTTNHLDKLDPALRRKGRMDLTFEVEPLDKPAVEHYLSVVGDREVCLDHLGDLNIPGCELPNIAMVAMQDVDKAVQLLEPFQVKIKQVA